jgi:hypothetical protein
MEADKIKTGPEQSENEVFFAPLEEIKTIESVIDKLETTRQELKKVAEAMKPIDEL